MVRQKVAASTTVVFWDWVRMGFMISERRMSKRPVWRVPRDALPTSPAYSPCTRSVRTVGWEGSSAMGSPIPFESLLVSLLPLILNTLTSGVFRERILGQDLQDLLDGREFLLLSSYPVNPVNPVKSSSLCLSDSNVHASGASGGARSAEPEVAFQGLVRQCIDSVGVNERFPDNHWDSDGDKAVLRVEIVFACLVNHPHVPIALRVCIR